MATNNTKENVCMEREEEFSSSYRWQHWIRAISIVALTITGFYIAKPFLSPVPNSEPTNFMYALMRSWHEIIGFVLIAVIIYKSYLFLFVKKHNAERKAFRDILDIKVWKEQIGYYLLISKHPKLRGIYNPLQFIAYIGFYAMIFGIIITGLILYIHTYHNGLGSFLYSPMRNLEVMMGGLVVVREVHHLLMWGIILFVTVHIYMAIYNAVFGKEGSMDAIFSGLKWKKEEH